MAYLIWSNVVFSFSGGTELLISHELYQVCFMSLYWLLDKEICLEFHDVLHVTVTNPQPFLFTVFRMSFYDNPMPFLKCYKHIFCFLKIIMEQIICSLLYTKKSTHINEWGNRFHFQIEQPADITKNNNNKSNIH